MLPLGNKNSDQTEETIRTDSPAAPATDCHTQEMAQQPKLVDIPKEVNPITQLCSELKKEFTFLQFILRFKSDDLSQLNPTHGNLTRLQDALIDLLNEYSTFHAITLDSYPNLRLETVLAMVDSDSFGSKAQNWFQLIFYTIQGFVADLIFLSNVISPRRYESFQETYKE